MLQTSRRAFLLLAGSAAVAAALPPPASAGADLEFGFTRDGQLYETGFRSRAAAAAAAGLERPDAAFTTAEVVRPGMAYPDELGELAVDHLLNSGHLGNHMVDWMICANEEFDAEGDFADACNLTDRSGLGESGRRALSAALARAGSPLSVEALADRAARGAVRDEIPDAVLESLSRDAVLAADLAAALRDWAGANGVEDSLRGLVVAEAEAHPAPRPVH